MKKIIAIGIIAMVSFSMIGANPVKFSAKEEMIEEGGMKETLYLHIPGYPALPYELKTYIFPLGTKINGVKVKVEGIKEMNAMERINPSPPPVADGIRMEYRMADVYEKDVFYPYSWYDYNIKVGIMNGKRSIFVNVYLYPYRYNAVKSKIKHAEKFDVAIDYEYGKIELPSNHDLLIIAPDSWLDELQPLVEHKEKHGIRTKLVGLSECLTMNGRDDAEKVKYYIKNAIEEDGIKYVMLVGGRHGGITHEKWWVPVRYTHLDDNSNWETGYLSDLYFSDIYKYEDGEIVFEDWDSNGNGVFAEWKGFQKDTLDLVPDVYVGRLACRNAMEVKAMVNKIIEYENSNAMQQDWFKRIILVGGDSWPQENDPYYEGEEENKVVMNLLPDFEPVKLWTSLGTLFSPDDVINAINGGAGFIFFDGHGNPMNWATHPPHDEDTWIDGLGVRDMKYLENKGMYPVCVVGGCHNCQFNVSILNLLKIYEGFSEWYSYLYKGETARECWGWWIARMADSGAIASLGYTGLDYFAVGDDNHDGIPDCVQFYSGFMHVNFFKRYANGSNILGEIHGDTIATYVNTFDCMKNIIDCKTAEEWVLLGDPSLKIGGY